MDCKYFTLFLFMLISKLQLLKFKHSQICFDSCYVKFLIKMPVFDKLGKGKQ